MTRCLCRACMVGPIYPALLVKSVRHRVATPKPKPRSSGRRQRARRKTKFLLDYPLVTKDGA